MKIFLDFTIKKFIVANIIKFLKIDITNIRRVKFYRFARTDILLNLVKICLVIYNLFIDRVIHF